MTSRPIETLQSDQTHLDQKEAINHESNQEHSKEEDIKSVQILNEQKSFQVQPCTYHCEPQIGYVLDLDPIEKGILFYYFASRIE